MKEGSSVGQIPSFESCFKALTGHAPMRWQELRSPELARCAEEDWLAVMPVGSLEQHGAHLFHDLA